MSTRRCWPRAVALAVALASLSCAGDPPPAAPKKTGVSTKKPPEPAVAPAGSSSPAAASTAPAPTATTGGDANVAIASPAPTLPPAPTPMPSARLTLRTGSQDADTWLTGPTLQRPRAGHIAAMLAGALTVFEGDVQPTLEVLEPAGGRWQLDERLVSGPGAFGGISIGRSFGALAESQGEVWLIGGNIDAGLQGDLVRYRAPSIAETRFILDPAVQAAAAGVVGERLIVAGGADAKNGPQPRTQVFMLPDFEDAKAADMPLGVAGAASAVAGGRLWVFGGYELLAGQPVARAAVQVYDPVADRWTRDGGDAGAPAALPLARHSAAAAVLDGKVYLVGGMGADGKVIGQVDVLDPVTGAWTRAAALPTPRALLALAVHAGRLWAIGGMGADDRPSGVVEVYRP